MTSPKGEKDVNGILYKRYKDKFPDEYAKERAAREAKHLTNVDELMKFLNDMFYKVESGNNGNTVRRSVIDCLT